MKRIFATLAVLNGICLLLSFTFGFGVMHARDLGMATPRPDQPLGMNWFTWHTVFSIFTAVLTLLVHCLIFTYFLGTGRWVKEVARAYRLADEDMPRLTREYKRRAFPPALFAMLSVIAAVATGAGAQTAAESIWAMAHPVLAVLTLVINGWAYAVEYRVVAANSEVMDRVMAEVERLQAASAPVQETRTVE